MRDEKKFEFDDTDKQFNEIAKTVFSDIAERGARAIAFNSLSALALMGKTDPRTLKTDAELDDYMRDVCIFVCYVLVAMPAVQNSLAILHGEMNKEERVKAMVRIIARAWSVDPAPIIAKIIPTGESKCLEE